MTLHDPIPVAIPAGGGAVVSGLIYRPDDAFCFYVFAHGAGAGMASGAMEAMAAALAKRGVASLRYNFPYMEAGAPRPDSAPVAHATVREAVAAVHLWFPGLPLIAGGRSFGGRMTSGAQAVEPLPGVCGLAFIAFPLHPAGKPGTTRADHLTAVTVPMLFLSGTNDALAELDLLRPVVDGLGARARLHLLDGADHSFKTRKGGRGEAGTRDDAADALAGWAREVTA